MKIFNIKRLLATIALSILVAGTSFAKNTGNSNDNNSRNSGNTTEEAPTEALSLIYGIDDDSDLIFYYDLSNDIDGVVSTTKLPNEMENLTWWEGNAYYSFQSSDRTNSSRHVDLYRINIDYNYNTETEKNEFTANWEKKATLNGIDHIDSVELIGGYFYFTDNHTDIFYKMDGKLNTIEQKYVGKSDDGHTLFKKIEGLAYDYVTKILYATNAGRYSSSENRSQLFAIYLGNGFNDMKISFLGDLPYYKVEGLVFNNGVLYGAGTSKIKQPDGSYGMFFEINFNEYGKVIPIKTGVTIPQTGSFYTNSTDYMLTTTNQPVNNWKADVEGIANVYCERHDGGACGGNYKVDLCHVTKGNGKVLLIHPNVNSTFVGHAVGKHGGDYLLNGESATLADGTTVDGKSCGDHSIDDETPPDSKDPEGDSSNENAFGRMNIREKSENTN